MRRVIESGTNEQVFTTPTHPYTHAPLSANSPPGARCL